MAGAARAAAVSAAVANARRFENGIEATTSAVGSLMKTALWLARRLEPVNEMYQNRRIEWMGMGAVKGRII